MSIMIAVKDKGFTILELVIVVIIVGILATVGPVQYTRTIERRGRAAEARTILGQLRSASITYKMERGSYPDYIDDISVEAPQNCTSTHYYDYAIGQESGNPGNSLAYAYRCTGGVSKEPAGSYYYWFQINFDEGTLEYCESSAIKGTSNCTYD
ncbi:MAG: prepilin-type N-terminal cleavage/methylation domain-containing protein [Candidatus Omnitrophica bacterium]|nr:prepilin-type N-terminal cleavage/methylation domain-containing protein [Candidatus Omnitrophota bacterium]